MFIDMINKTIPRSIRAGIALFLTFILFGAGMKSLQDLLVPGEDPASTVVKCIGGIVLGTVAGCFFFYFQSKDGAPLHYSELDTLNSYHAAERERKKMAQTEITPAYDFEEKEQSSSK